MALAYREPGIQISEVVNPQINPLLAAPADICLIGLSRGYQIRTDQFRLSGTTAVPLPGLPAGAKVDTGTVNVTVKNSLDPTAVYTSPDDYTVNTETGTITRIAAGDIANDSLVDVTYAYLPEDYFQPYRLFDQGSVEERYGPSLASDGVTISSPVSYAASIAFENGASNVIIQPLFALATPGDINTAKSNPPATGTGNASTVQVWTDTLLNLRDIEDINIIVPVHGQSQGDADDARQLAILQAIQDHIKFMKDSDQYILGIFGEDGTGTGTEAIKTVIRTHAETLRGRYGGETASQTVLLSPAKFRRSSGAGKTIAVGGQYVAAAIAGMIASRPVNNSLTRKLVGGFTEITDPRTRQEKDDDAAAGLCVIEQRRGVIQVRHAITLDTSQSATREISVVRAKHRMIESIRDTLDRQVIGNLIADQNAPIVVAQAVESVLAELLQARDLVDYSRIESRLVSLEPTKIQVRFSYRPAFPVNYIDVEFSLDLTNNTVTGNTA